MSVKANKTTVLLHLRTQSYGTVGSYKEAPILMQCKDCAINLHVCIREGERRETESTEERWFSVCYSSD